MVNLFMRFPLGKSKAFTMSYDDGVEQDIKLIEIMNQNGLKGTFNLNSGLFAPEGTVYEAGKVHRRMTLKQVLTLFKGSGQEVAVHGLTHPFLDSLPMTQILYEVMEDRKRLEELFQCTIRGMAYPYGRTNETTREALKAAGIVYARTVKQTESFEFPNDWLNLDPTCHHTNPKLMQLGDKFLGQREDRQAQMFYLWGHSYEFEADNNWDMITSFCQRIGKQSSVWYATNLEIYDYVTAYQQLRFGVSMQFVENPTAMDLYFTWNGKDYCVKKGDCIDLN